MTTIRHAALMTGAALAVTMPAFAGAQTTAALATTAVDGQGPVAPAAEEPQAQTGGQTEGQDIVVTGANTRSVTQITGVEMQRVLPGVSPLQALQTLPGVTYLTADPWGNNEQNI